MEKREEKGENILILFFCLINNFMTFKQHRQKTEEEF